MGEKGVSEPKNYLHRQLGLPEFEVVKRQESADGNVLYTVIPKEEIRVCPNCGGKLHIHKKVQRKIKDLDEFGKRVGILARVTYYRCQKCGASVQPEFPSLYKQMTRRLAEAVTYDSYRNTTFTEVAKKYHVSISTVQQLFEEHGNECWEQYHFVAPRVLGIDEVHLNNAYYGVFIRVDKNDGRIIELSEERTKKAVIEVLQRMEQPENLQYVTMDMWRAYRDAVHYVFPNTPIIIDHFHVVKELIKCLDKVRSDTCKAVANVKERKSLKRNRYLLLSNGEGLSPSYARELKALLEAYPQFKTPYYLKESFRNIFDFAKSKNEALQLYDEWCKECKKNNVTAYDSFIDTVNNWQEEIFAYFDYDGPDRTNAQTESFNRCIRSVARDGRGYSFENLRTKMIFRMKEQSSTRFDFESFLLEEEK